MIRNTLYSLFLHFLLLLLIYANFNLKTIDESQITDISISLLEIDTENSSSEAKEIAKKEPEKEAPKEVVKEIVKPIPLKDTSEDKKEPIKEGDVFVLTYVPGIGLKTIKNNKLLSTIEGEDFKKALWGIWLGPDPIDASVKTGILGN